MARLPQFSRGRPSDVRSCDFCGNTHRVNDDRCSGFQPTLLAQPFREMPDLRLSTLQCVCARMHGVGTFHEIVGASQSGPEDESTSSVCDEIDRMVPFLEYHQLALAERTS